MDNIVQFHRKALIQATPVAVVYLLTVQASLFLLPYRSDIMWLAIIRMGYSVEAMSLDGVIGLLTIPGWWVGLLFPFAVSLSGFLSAYSHITYKNPFPALVSIFYLLSLYSMALFFPFSSPPETRLLYLLVASPVVVAVLVTAVHFFAPQRYSEDTN